jgi:hypothetical protein
MLHLHPLVVYACAPVLHVYQEQCLHFKALEHSWYFRCVRHTGSNKVLAVVAVNVGLKTGSQPQLTVMQMLIS